mgnify:FL=1
MSDLNIEFVEVCFCLELVFFEGFTSSMILLGSMIVVWYLMKVGSQDEIFVGLRAPPNQGHKAHFRFQDQFLPMIVQEMQYQSPSGISSIP